MTEKELRELDAWISEHVMGWLFNRHGIPFSPHPDDKWEKETVVPHYTTDPAASMMVLKKCAQKMSPDGGESAPVIEWLGDVEESWRVVESDHFDGIKSEASSLELAICLFAKQLFHAQEKETQVH